MNEVIGQANPAVDVPAVQEAVDAGGTVVLKGTFNFEGVSQPGPDPFGVFRGAILVTAPVVIRGEAATIHGGGSTTDGGFQAAFLVIAPGSDVALEGLRFVSPANAAIRVAGAGSLRIAGCEVDGVVPTVLAAPDGSSITGALGFHLLGAALGAVTIVDNDIRIGGSAKQSTGGINVLAPVERVEIIGNRIRETTAHGMNLQNVGGPALIERNVVETGPVGRSGEPGEFVDALRVLGTGEYRVLRNDFDCGTANCAGVRVAATTNAEIRQNEIVLSVTPDEVPGSESAGIQVRGTALDNRVLQNRIRGRGRVAISVVHSSFPPDRPPGTDGNPAGNNFQGNNFQQFDATVAAVEIGEGVRDTTIVGGSGILIDHGTGTVAQGNFVEPEPAL
jgi:hypothetical protein